MSLGEKTVDQDFSLSYENLKNFFLHYELNCINGVKSVCFFYISGLLGLLPSHSDPGFL